MGYDYALVHLQYTIPPAVALTVLYRPLATALDVYKLLFLIFIAVVATTPWDSYLIHKKIWTYPADAIVGPTLFRIPAEEIFFFCIQTYSTSLLYLIISKPTFHPVYLRSNRVSLAGKLLHLKRWLGQAGLMLGILLGTKMVLQRGKSLYMGMILIWAGPFVLLLWSLAYPFIITLPFSNTLLPIALPTVYLWIVDTLALKRGTWVIEPGTKFGWHLWDGLDIEEAMFFFVSNILVVFGLIAFDHAIAILHSFPALFPIVPPLPSPALLVQALLTPASKYDERRISGLQDALARLQQKSRSFYLASGVFQGRLRIDLILLYSFCRVADDLVDGAPTTAQAKHWIAQLARYLDIRYAAGHDSKDPRLFAFLDASFPLSTRDTLLLLPTSYLSPSPLYELLKGFEIDVEFNSTKGSFPIKDDSALELYAARVAGTVAKSCLELVYHHIAEPISEPAKQVIIDAGGRMGIALQYVNIARDVTVDAQIGRVYLPTTWLHDNGISPESVLKGSDMPKVEALRQRLLRKAMGIYENARGAINSLPAEARGPMRVAVESYIEIGRVLMEPGYKVKAGRATVPKMRRLRVAWSALTC